VTSTQTSNTQLRAGCYHRISNDPKDRRTGVDRQRQDTAALCEVQGWTPAGDYTDNDRSASNGQRRQHWERLLADIRDGKIDAIAAWDQDRNWRMMHDLEELRRFFATVGREIRLATTGQGVIDLFSPTGVLAAQIKTAVSEHEIAMMKVRMRRAARDRAERGIPAWRKAFGYDVGECHEDCPPKCNGYHIDPVNAPLVRDAYRAALAGVSMCELARRLNALGARGGTGKPWSSNTVSLFLRKPRNAGLRSHNDEIVLDADGRPVKGTWPALVDEKTWRAVQTVLTAPGRGSRRSVRRHMLTGLLVCGKPGCGAKLAGGQPANGVPSYRCKVCGGVSVRASDIEPTVYRLVGGRLAMPDAADLLRAEIDDTEADAIRAELAALYARRQQIGIERGQGLLDGQTAKIALDVVAGEVAAAQRRQQDDDRLRLLADLPLGQPEAVEAVKRLSPDRFRAVADVLATITVAPVGKGAHVFNPERVQVNWR
jgi:DNA invertase Pin-like site-specific DNA recombinase